MDTNWKRDELFEYFCDLNTACDFGRDDEFTG